MKNHFKLLGLLLGLLFSGSVAQAQLTFVNNTACGVRVTGTYNYNANPCVSTYFCTEPITFCPPFSTIVLTGSGPCISPFPTPPANFVRVGINPGSVLGAGVNWCGIQVTNYTDCTGALRTFQIFSPNFAAVF